MEEYMTPEKIIFLAVALYPVGAISVVQAATASIQHYG
jgi:hypothetical protein